MASRALEGSTIEKECVQYRVALVVLAEVLAPRIAPARIPSFVKPLFAPASADIAIERLSRFDLSLTDRELYKEVISPTPGERLYVLISTATHTAFAINTLAEFANGIGERYLSYMEFTEGLVAQWLLSPLIVRRIASAAWYLLAALIPATP
jgi:hypothetical protein